MFANVFVSSLRASAMARPAARVVPRALPASRTFSTTVARRSGTTTKKQLDNEVRRGFDEIVPFLKRIPVDVYPLVTFVSFACVLGVYYMGKHLFFDEHLRREPARAYKYDNAQRMRNMEAEEEE